MTAPGNRRIAGLPRAAAEDLALGWNALPPTRWRSFPNGRNQRVGGNAFHFPSGFTLLEILLAIALLGLIAAVLVTGGANVLSDQPATPEAVFWASVRQARKTALQAEHEVRLAYDPKVQAFVVDDGAAKQTLPVPPTQDLAVDFLSAQPGSSSVLIGGEFVDTKTIPAVSFYADGTCSPFRVQFRAGGAARVLAIDPWTCAPVLPRVEAAP